MSLNHSYNKLVAFSHFTGCSVVLQVRINGKVVSKPNHQLINFMDDYKFKFVKRDGWFRYYGEFSKKRFNSLKEAVKNTNYELVLPSVEYVREVVKYINDDDLERFINTPNE